MCCIRGIWHSSLVFFFLLSLLLRSSGMSELHTIVTARVLYYCFAVSPPLMHKVKLGVFNHGFERPNPEPPLPVARCLHSHSGMDICSCSLTFLDRVASD